MPLHDDGHVRQFTEEEIDAMEINSFDVRFGNHPTETCKIDENTMTRKFHVKWEERFNFVELVLGREVFWYDAEFDLTKLSRLLPHEKWGRHPTKPLVVASRIDEIKGHGVGRDGEDGVPYYPKAEITVFYEQLPYYLGAQEDAGYSSEIHRFIYPRNGGRTDLEAYGPIPGGALRATRDGGGGMSGSGMPYNFSITQPIYRFQVVWAKLPWKVFTDTGMLFQRLFKGEFGDPNHIPFVGSVCSHDMEFTGFNRTYPAGTLLLEGAVDDKHRSPLGEEDDVTANRIDVIFD